MKTIAVSRDFNYRPKRHVVVKYIGGETYRRVPEAAVRAIVDAGAGRIVTDEQEAGDGGRS